MTILLDGDTLRIRGTDEAQYAAIQSWGKTRWDRKRRELRGWADLDLLDRLAGLTRLPPEVQRRRERLRAVQEAVDRERTIPDPAPLYDYPVKTPLYIHQTRAANMALLTFGWAGPGKEAKKWSG